MLSAASTIDISPTPFQSRVLSLPMEWDLLLDGGLAGGNTFEVILEVFRRVEPWGAQARTLITGWTQGALLSGAAIRCVLTNEEVGLIPGLQIYLK